MGSERSAAPAELIECFLAEGFGNAGVVRLPLDDAYAGALEARYREWIQRGAAAGMDFLQRHAPLKFRPERLLPGARSLVIAALPYWTGEHAAAGSVSTAGTTPTACPPGHGRVARYAYGRDYHRVVAAGLRAVMRRIAATFPGARCRPFVDSLPIHEKTFAVLAGLGFIGRNTLLITPAYGSYCVLGGVITTVDLPTADGPVLRGRDPQPGAGCPPGCRRCIAACPTGALSADGCIDAARCIAYLTVEHRGPIAAPLQPLVGDRLFGCDACQEACPLNRRPAAESRADNLPAAGRPGGVAADRPSVPAAAADLFVARAGSALPLAEVSALTAADFAQRFAGTSLMRSTRDGLVRNATVVAAVAAVGVETGAATAAAAGECP